MAHIEIHALSVKLAGTFEAHVFFPEQEVEKAEEKFPVLWMIHEDGTGTFDLMRHAALMEKIAEEKKMFDLKQKKKKEKNVCNCSDDKSFACNQYGIWHKE